MATTSTSCFAQPTYQVARLSAQCYWTLGATPGASEEFYSCSSWRRIAGRHEAEELLLRALVAPTAERWMAGEGLDEPGYRVRGASAGTPASENRPQDLLDELVVIAATMASTFLQVGPQPVQQTCMV